MNAKPTTSKRKFRLGENVVSPLHPDGGGVIKGVSNYYTIMSKRPKKYRALSDVQLRVSDNCPMYKIDGFPYWIVETWVMPPMLLPHTSTCLND